MNEKGIHDGVTEGEKREGDDKMWDLYGGTE